MRDERAKAFVRLVVQDVASEESVLRKARRAGLTEQEVRRAAEELGIGRLGDSWVRTRRAPQTDHGATVGDLRRWFPWMDREIATELLRWLRQGFV